MTIVQLQEQVWEHYQQYGREMPWRTAESDGSFDPYKILVSEVMLQQTQVTRVVPKYSEFLRRFPTLQALASASLGEVLAAWNGLGYNRRAKFLWQAAQIVVEKQEFPRTLEELITLPGVGRNTAAAVLVYAYNQPLTFIETNIRTVYIHHFFPHDGQVTDKQISELVSESLDAEHPREWYWALMDYGSHLKATVGNVSRSSKHYAKQSAFRGSNREIRGKIVKLLAARPYTLKELEEAVADDRFSDILQDLIIESLVRQTDDQLSI